MASPEAPPGSNFRYERKFLVAGPATNLVDSILKRHPSFFREIYQERQVSNIYLDSPALKSMRDNIDGNKNRTKTRIRWYGPIDAQANKVTLELKIKRGLVGKKVSFALAPLASRGGCSPQITDQLFAESQLPDNLRLHLSLLRPTLLNSYTRRYFLSADGHFRITVDRVLRYYPATAAGLSLISQDRETVVVELKFDVEHSGDADPIASALPFRLSRSSKYVTGMQMVHGIQLSRLA